MKKLTTAALLVGGAIMASQSAFGQGVVANDLYFGFENAANGGSQDYIINLGAASSIVGQTSVVNLSSDFSVSDFNAVLGSSSSMFGGVIGAASTSVSGVANTADVYATQLRSGGAGTPSTAGSSAPAGISRTTDNNAYNHLATLDGPAANSGTLDPNRTWESDVEPTFTTSSFSGITGVNPDSSVSPSTVLYEDLWETVSSASTGTKPFNYLGYFTLDVATDTLTFTGADVVTAVPEPSTYGMLAGVGVLLLALRRQLTGIVA